MILFTLAVIMWAFRFPLLRGLGNFLIREDPSCRADVIYTLGGSPLDRGVFTATLLKQGCAPLAYCTGENVPGAYKAEGRLITEADIDTDRCHPCRLNTNTSSTIPIRNKYMGRSGRCTTPRAITWAWIRSSLVTTDFHTRRVKNVFERRFEGSGITVLVKAAPSSDYEVDEWFRTEQGLLMVNNEYVKTLYYAITY